MFFWGVVLFVGIMEFRGEGYWGSVVWLKLRRFLVVVFGSCLFIIGGFFVIFELLVFRILWGDRGLDLGSGRARREM